MTRLPLSRRLASSDFCYEAGFTLVNKDDTETVLCLQGHPEFDADYSAALLDAIKDKVGTNRTALALASLAQKTDTELVAGWIRRFFTAATKRHERAA